MRRVLALLTLMACGGGTVVETDISGDGSACLDGEEILVDFATCLSSSCDTLTASCETSLEGDTVVVTSTATVATTVNVDCTADCGLAQTTCTLPAGATEATQIRYGETTVPIDAPCETL